jgi:type IV pilus assembly protein PilM
MTAFAAVRRRLTGHEFDRVRHFLIDAKYKTNDARRAPFLLFITPMAKNPSTVIGIDLGRHSLKAVLMQKKGGGRIVLQGYTIQPLSSELDSPQKIASELRGVAEKLKPGLKACGVALPGDEGIIRIIEQPPTPREIMRDALRFNGATLLGQDVREMVVDCDVIEEGAVGFSSDEGGRSRFLVVGVERKRIEQIDKAFSDIKAALKTIQPAPVAMFNAFEFAQAQVFMKEAFLLVDIGHKTSTVMVGAKKGIVLVRSIDYGGKVLLDALMSAGADTPHGALQALERGDEEIVEAARISLATLTREISSSIGFFEGRCEENIARVHISGGPAQSRSIIQILAEELHLPCMAWNPFERCEIALPEASRATLRSDVVNLHTACGVALGILKGN